MKKLISLVILILSLIACKTNNSLRYEMVLVEPGSFQMGSETGFINERPVHLVEITKAYYIGIYEVTFDQYDAYTSEIKYPIAEPEATIRGNRPAMGMDWIKETQ